MESDKKKKVLKDTTLGWFLILHGSLLLNSLAGVASKFAGREEIPSFRFLLFYGIVILITFVFALAWQQVLKHMSLTFAFTSKPITVIYALIWGALFFHEQVTLKMVLGAVVIMIGIIVGITGEETKA